MVAHTGASGGFSQKEAPLGLSSFQGPLALGWEGTRSIEGLWVGCGQDARKGHPRTIPRNMGQGCRVRHHSSTAPPSLESRLSAEARNLGKESAVCVCVQPGEES